MTVTDPIADMLNRLRNAAMARHDSLLMPSSKMKLALVKILKEEGFIKDYEVVRGKPHRAIKVVLKYGENKQPAITGLRRISKPGLRVYTERHEIPRVFGGLGIAIVSTSKGVVSGHKAWHDGLGGELLCYIW